MRSWAACWSTTIKPSRSATRCRSRGSASVPHRADDRADRRQAAPRSAHRRSACRHRKRPVPVRQSRCAAAFESRHRPGRIGRRAPPVPIAGPRRKRRTERGDRRAIGVGGGAAAFAGEAVLQRMHDQRADQTGIAEPHLGLGRMHIGIDLLRRQRHEQRHHRMAVARQIVGIGARAPRRGSACRAPGGR